MTKISLPMLVGTLLIGAQSLRAASPANRRDPVPSGVFGNQAVGMGINLSVVGRVIGRGDTLFRTAVDVTNNTDTATEVDFYFAGTSNGVPVGMQGSISSSDGIFSQGASTGGFVAGHQNVHFDDFIDALFKTGNLRSDVEANGVIGSVLFVFNGFNKSGQGAANARIYNDGCGGTVGESINGREITSNESTSLLVTARNTVGAVGPQLYTNLFINNIGLTPTGSGEPSADDDILVTALSGKTGTAVGKAIRIAGLGTGATAVIDVFSELSIPPSEDTVILEIDVVSGTCAIDAVAVAVDMATHDAAATKAANGSFITAPTLRVVAGRP